jgi:hypothetical protein
MPNDKGKLLILADLSATDLDSLNPSTVVALAQAHHRLSLATPEEFIRRRATVDQQRAEAQVRVEKEMKGRMATVKLA